MFAFLQSFFELLTLVFKSIFKHASKKKSKSTDHRHRKDSNHQENGERPKRRRRTSITETTTTTKTTEFVVSGDSPGSSPTLPDQADARKD